MLGIRKPQTVLDRQTREAAQKIQLKSLRELAPEQIRVAVQELFQDVAAQVDGYSYPISAAALLDAC